MPCSSSVFSCLSGIPWVSQAFFLPQTRGWAFSVILSAPFFSNSDAARVSHAVFFSKTHGWAVSVILGTSFFSNSVAARVSQTIFFSKTRGWTISNMKASQNKQPAGLSTRFYVSDPRAIVNYYLYSGCSVFLFPTYTI